MTNEQIGYSLSKLTALVLELSKDIEAVRKDVKKALSSPFKSKTTELNHLRKSNATLKAQLRVRGSLESSLSRFLGEEQQSHDHEKAVKKKFKYERYN